MSKELSTPSEEFMEAVIHSSSIISDCTLCGRTHFNGEASSFEEGEFEDSGPRQVQFCYRQGGYCAL